MENLDVVVVGGSAGGLCAAVTARRHYPKKNITLIRKENRVMVPCGIPYIFGTLEEPEKNLMPDGVFEKNNIRLIVGQVETLNPGEKKISMGDGQEIAYDRLILATGSDPLLPPIPGIDKENVFPVKKDLPYLRSVLETVNQIKDLVILGCGFIGVEFADECKKNRDINVTVVEMLDQCLKVAFGEETCRCCQEIQEALIQNGVNIITGTKLTEVLGNEKVTGVKLSGGRELKADAVIVGIGVKPNIKLAKEAGLDINKIGIVVDNNMRTSDPYIFACGDCASKVSFFTGEPFGLRLASIASQEARIAGANLFGTRRKNQGVVGVFATMVNNITVGCAGMSEKWANENGYEVVSGEAEAPDRHPGSMPGMSKLWVRLVFNKINGELVGGSVRGGSSAGELINTISACIQNRMTADDIAVFQVGTHPAVTASPIAYQLINAAEIALKTMKSG